jgi:outer membrane protein assembly factor BamB
MPERVRVLKAPASASFLLVALLPPLWPRSALPEDWPQFRGPGGQGHSAERGLPSTWSETENIAWKVPVPGRGWSSPVVQGDQIWLTTALDDGHSLRALCFHREDGRVLSNVEVFQKENPGQIHAKNSHASPTPVLSGNRVFVHFGAHGTAGLSTAGEVLWKTALKYEHRHGPAGSPIVFGNKLILSCDGTDVQFLVALDCETGKVRWKKDRSGPMAYSTPLAIQVNGQDQIVSTGGDRAAAYDPLTGEEIWWVRYEGYSLVPRPVYGGGLVFLCTGFNTPSLYAVRPDGKGDLTETGVPWTTKRGVPHNPSPLLAGKELYFVSDGGVLSCAEAETGRVHWQNRLGGSFSASPVFAEGRLYFLDEEGVTTVISPGTELKKLGTSRLEGRTLASMAVSGQAFFLRTESHLYRIQDQGKTKKPDSN